MPSVPVPGGGGTSPRPTFREERAVDVEVLEPRTVEEAAALRAEHGDEAKLLAGGTALVLMLRNRLVAPRYLISLNTIEGLRDVTYTPGQGLRLGALATIAQAERSAAVRER